MIKVSVGVLKSYVEEYPDHMLKEIGAVIGLSDSKVWKHLNQMNMTRKKRPLSMRNVAPKSERPSGKEQPL